MKPQLSLVLWFACACGLGGPAHAETGTMLRASDLKSKPYLDADNLAKLPEHAAVDVLVRQGPWMQVRYQGKQGYVRMLQVRLDVSDAMVAHAPTPASSMPVTRSSSSMPMVTTGVRGFDEQGLKDAEPAPEQYKAMLGYAASAEQAQQFAEQAQLAARHVPYYDDAGKPIKGGKK
jgi:hypothetical protein